MGAHVKHTHHNTRFDLASPLIFHWYLANIRNVYARNVLCNPKKLKTTTKPKGKHTQQKCEHFHFLIRYILSGCRLLWLAIMSFAVVSCFFPSTSTLGFYQMRSGQKRENVDFSHFWRRKKKRQPSPANGIKYAWETVEWTNGLCLWDLFTH